MSSGTVFDYTAEEKAALLDQAADVLGLVQERKRSPQLVKQAFQAVIGDHEILVQPKISQTPSGNIFHVTSDVKIRTAADVIAATGCKVKWGLAETPDKIPMIIQPVDEHVRAVPLGKVMTAEEIYFSFPKSTTPAGWAAFGAKFPEEQRKAPHIVIWLDASGRFFCGALRVYDVERRVFVSPCIPDFKFNADCCVLVRE